MIKIHNERRLCQLQINCQNLKKGSKNDFLLRILILFFVESMHVFIHNNVNVLIY